MFEESLAGKERMIVYTKSDLGNTGSRVDLQVWIQAMTVDMDKNKTDGVDRNII
jgi:hypothetical protein